jgi:SAM-dependent methyltransferase
LKKALKKQLNGLNKMDKEQYYNKRHQSKREITNLWKNFKDCKNVLDLGCGAGSFGQYKPENVEVYGIDIDPNALIIAEKYEKAQIGDVTKELPYIEEFFDGVLAKDIIEHVLEPWKLGKEINRVLKKDGVVVAVVPCPGKKAWDDYTHVRPFTKRAIKELFLDHGFEIEYIKRTRGIPGFGLLGLNVLVPYILKIPIIHLLTQGFMVKARKK